MGQTKLIRVLNYIVKNTNHYLKIHKKYAKNTARVITVQKVTDS